MRPVTEMTIKCPTCGCRLLLGQELLRPGSGPVRCGRCGAIFESHPRENNGSEAARATARQRPTVDPANGPGPLACRPACPKPPPGLVAGTLGLAFGNLSRHQRRTLLSGLAVVFGVVALLLAGGFIEWSVWQLREATVESRLGHIQVVRPGYFQEGAADPHAYLMPDPQELLQTVRRLPHVAALTPRLSFSGLISKGETTVSFLGEGVLPETEARVSLQVSLLEGTSLQSAEPRQIILGKGLALSLGARPGDTVVLLANTPQGGVSGLEARVGGIFQTATKAFDDVALRVPIGLARELLRVEGSHTWVLLLDETEHTDEVLSLLRDRYPTAAAGLEFVPWHALADFYKKVVALFSAQVNFVRLVIALIIVVSISNMLGLAVMERTPEIGTLMALGVRRRGILGLFLTEGLLLGLLAGLVGVVAGYGLAAVVSMVGIPMPPAPGVDFSYVGRIRVSAPLAITSFLLAVTATLAASLWPAWRASRLEIVDALRHAR